MFPNIVIHGPEFYLVMLWSQIKLTSYDFSDLHITGEFGNRPGTGRLPNSPVMLLNIVIHGPGFYLVML